MLMMKRKLPSPALALAGVSLFVAMSGGAYAATTLGHGVVHTSNVARGAVTNSKLGGGSVGPGKLNTTLRTQLAQHNGVGPQGARGADGTKGDKGESGRDGINGMSGATGAAGTTGKDGANGKDGTNGKDGANPATAVQNVPAIKAGDTNNGNPDSGQPGDAGWYFSGNGAGGSAQFEGGALLLQGNGVDSNTFQGAPGIAHAYNSVPLGQLSAVSYSWWLDQVNATQAPTIHVTVLNAGPDSKFGSSGFTNYDYNPAINGITTATESQQYLSDAFAPGAKWFSTAEPIISNPGGENNPEPLSYFVGNDPSAVIIQISLDNGGTSGGTGTFAAGADDLLLGFDGNNTRYDFGG